MTQNMAATCTWDEQEFCMEFMAPYIIFPNGDVVEVRSWSVSTDASTPSTPQGLRPYSKIADLGSLEQVAQEIGGVLAYPKERPSNFIVSTVDVAVTNDDQARPFVRRWCEENGRPKGKITDISMFGKGRLVRIRDPEMEGTICVMVDIFGDVHPWNN